MFGNRDDERRGTRTVAAKADPSEHDRVEDERPPGPGDRRSLITGLVLDSGSVSAQELAERFGVSVMTIHRDLDELQRQGVLRKARGVATAQPSGTFESNVEYRRRVNADAKRAIAARAAGLVEPGMSVLVDDSTTAAHLIPHLAELAPLTVATNYLHALTELSRLRDVQVVALGGTYDVQHDSFLGTTCVEAIRSMRFDVAFVSTSAVTAGHAFHQEDRIVAVKREMVTAAERCHLLIDHSKLTRSALHRLLPLEGFTSVIVDSATPREHLARLREHDVPVEVAGDDG
ncbi:DeoR/GlpR family DNA-binding transcription regulator [Streptomonospora nanhaiensis]|uniref:DeoR/GlpR family DNA-binding transcription regulator n=1 Tax=Streptomonospora nanhaiensis TaxID=1323731 RepID=A0ABY6YK66_9ACTN|nr:DeoR/GlpR family DNA-binding transcription regulator [Streptomonospora nanhaiensis]WAE72564.1 DeoR/GlpR family DNA-binding transcription regulator [Streptomonospora nanhaiensis]